VSERFERIVLGLSVAAAAGYVGLYVVLSVQRVGYPFELEWMEGGSLEHLMRVLRGEPLYVTPSIDFVPFPYPPFYYYLAALVSKLTGPGFLPLRAISLASSLGTAVIVHLFVRRETGRAVYGLIAAGIFLGTWRASGLYFDIARLDSLFTFLLLASLYVLRFNSKPVDLVLAALLGGFAVMTKQTGAVVLAPVALWCAFADWRAHGRDLARFREWRRFGLFGLPLAAFVGGGTLLLNGIVDDNFLLHIVNAQQQHAILTRMIGFFFWRDLLLVLPISALLILAWLWIVRSERREWDGFYGVVLVTVLLACLIPRIKVGGAANNLILAHAWLAASMGVAIARVRAHIGERRPAVASKLPGWLAVGLLLQLLVLFRVPAGYLPSEADLEAGRALAARVAQIDGEVLMPVQGYLAGRAGKRVYAHQMPASDYAKSGLPEAGPLLESYEQAVRERRFAAIVDSNTAFLRGYLRDGLLEREYVRKGWLFQDPNVLLPISGAQIRSGTLWVPRD
jgi:hypothetical protein